MCRLPASTSTAEAGRPCARRMLAPCLGLAHPAVAGHPARDQNARRPAFAEKPGTVLEASAEDRRRTIVAQLASEDEDQVRGGAFVAPRMVEHGAQAVEHRQAEPQSRGEHGERDRRRSAGAHVAPEFDQRSSSSHPAGLPSEPRRDRSRPLARPPGPSDALLFEQVPLVAVAPRLAPQTDLAARIDHSLPGHDGSPPATRRARSRPGGRCPENRRAPRPDRRSPRARRGCARRRRRSGASDSGVPAVPRGSSLAAAQARHLAAQDLLAGEVALVVHQRPLPRAVVRIGQQDPARSASARRSARQARRAPPAAPVRRSRSRPDRPR